MESYLDKAVQSESDLKGQLVESGAQLRKTQEEMAKLVRNLESATKKYMNKKEAFKALQTELQNETVPLEEFNRIKEACER